MKSDATAGAELLEAFADALERTPLPDPVLAELADRLGDTGGARYAGVGTAQLNLAHEARAIAGRLKEGV